MAARSDPWVGALFHTLPMAGQQSHAVVKVKAN
jgi:hypothetical protein